MYGLVDDGGALGATDIAGRSPSKGAKRYMGGEYEKNNEIGFAEGLGKTWQPSASSISTEDKCLDICERMLVRINAEDPFSFPMQSSASGFRTKSTVVGGPGFNSGQLDRGDVVLKVDNVDVNRDSILDALVGDDTPGSEISLTVQKGGKAGNLRVVKFRRMATERIADRRRAFELFTLIKDRADQLKDDKIPPTVDKCIALLTNMYVGDTYYQEKATKRFTVLQDQCTRWLEEMCIELKKRKGTSKRSTRDILSGEDKKILDSDSNAAKVDACRLILQLQAELADALSLIRQCIDEHSNAGNFPRKYPGDKGSPPLSLKERVTRDAVEKGILRAEKNHEQKMIARLHSEVDTYKAESKKWEMEAALAKKLADVATKQAQQARAEATERMAISELWRKKAEDCHREMGAAEDRWKKEAASQSINDGAYFSRELHEEKLLLQTRMWQKESAQLESNWRDEKVELESQLRALTEQIQATAQNKIQHEATQNEMLRRLEAQNSDVELLKKELHIRGRFCFKEIEKLENEISDIAIKVWSKMQEENVALDAAARSILKSLHAIATGAVVEKTISGDARVGNNTVLQNQNFEHFTSLADTLSKVQSALEVLSEQALQHKAALQDKEVLMDAQERLQELHMIAENEILQLKAALQDKDDAQRILMDSQKDMQVIAENELLQLKTANGILISDISQYENESLELKVELGKTRTANARLSTIVQDLERQHSLNRIPSHLPAFSLTANSPWNSPRISYRESPRNTHSSTPRGSNDQDTADSLIAALKKIKEQEEEIRELKGYCTALRMGHFEGKSPQKNVDGSAVNSMLGCA